MLFKVLMSCVYFVGGFHIIMSLSYLSLSGVCCVVLKHDTNDTHDIITQTKQTTKRKFLRVLKGFVGVCVGWGLQTYEHTMAHETQP